MGHVVAACGQGHVMFDNKGIEAQSDRVFDGFKAIGEHVRAAKPDVLIIISGDHMFNVSTPIQVPLAVAVGDTRPGVGSTWASSRKRDSARITATACRRCS